MDYNILPLIEEQISKRDFKKVMDYIVKNIPDLPDLNGMTIKYDYDEENHDILLRWQEGYHTSECKDDCIYDLDADNKIIGIELLHFDLSEVLKV
jgi:hypothetical protein